MFTKNYGSAQYVKRTFIHHHRSNVIYELNHRIRPAKEIEHEIKTFHENS